MKNVRRVVLGLVAAGLVSLVPGEASAQGLWFGTWGWGGPVAIAPAPVFYGGFGPTYVSTYRVASWGYPGYAMPAYAPPVYYPPVYRSVSYGPVYGGPVYGGPVYVGPRAHAIRVANRVARRNWRWGYGWGW